MSFNTYFRHVNVYVLGYDVPPVDHDQIQSITGELSSVELPCFYARGIPCGNTLNATSLTPGRAAGTCVGHYAIGVKCSF